MINFKLFDHRTKTGSGRCGQDSVWVPHWLFDGTLQSEVTSGVEGFIGCCNRQTARGQVYNCNTDHTTPCPGAQRDLSKTYPRFCCVTIGSLPFALLILFWKRKCGNQLICFHLVSFTGGFRWQSPLMMKSEWHFLICFVFLKKKKSYLEFPIRYSRHI